MQLYERSPGTLFVSSDWGMLRAMFSFFAGCLVHDLRLYSNGRLDMPNILEAACAVLVAAFVLVTPSGGPQYLFPLLAAVVICVFSFDQGWISAMLRSPALQKLGPWSYSIYMIHTFVFQIMRSAASFIGHKLHLELVVWHNDDKLVALATPAQALVAALVRRPRCSRRRAHLSLDREAGDGCGPTCALDDEPRGSAARCGVEDRLWRGNMATVQRPRDAHGRRFPCRSAAAALSLHGTSGRGSETNLSRFGILIAASAFASSTASPGTRPLRLRM
jgi:acyltransferase-like protein